MIYNLANLDELTRAKINIDLAASAVAFKERHHIPVIVEQVEQAQPTHLRNYFRTRVAFYRQISINFTHLYHNLRKNPY